VVSSSGTAPEAARAGVTSVVRDGDQILIDLAQRKLDFWSTRRRLNVVERHITRGHFPGEPIFVRRPGATADNDGILLSVVLDGRAGRSYLLALDPPTLESRARAFLPHHVPSGFPAHSRCFEAGDLAKPRVRMSHTNSGSFGQRERHQAGEGPEVRVRLPPPFQEKLLNDINSMMSVASYKPTSSPAAIL
jgi:hypothetical protein